MAFFNGSALDRFHLLSIIKDRAESVGWGVILDTSQTKNGELVLQIPNGGFIGIQERSAEPLDAYQFALQGFTEYDTQTSFNSQTTRIPTNNRHGVAITLRDCGLRYWMHINDRRIVIIIRSGTNYESAYLGRLNSTASPTEYPFPLFISGTLNTSSSGTISKQSTSFGQLKNHWTTEDNTHETTFINANKNAYVMTPAQEWKLVENNFRGEAPFIFPTRDEMRLLGRNFDGSLPLFEMVMTSGIDTTFDIPAGSVYGYLDGIYTTTSEGVAAEDTISQDGDLYTIFQNVYKGEFGSHFALKRN